MKTWLKYLMLSILLFFGCRAFIENLVVMQAWSDWQAESDRAQRESKERHKAHHKQNPPPTSCPWCDKSSY